MATVSKHLDRRRGLMLRGLIAVLVRALEDAAQHLPARTGSDDKEGGTKPYGLNTISPWTARNAIVSAAKWVSNPNGSYIASLRLNRQPATLRPRTPSNAAPGTGTGSGLPSVARQASSLPLGFLPHPTTTEPSADTSCA